MPSWLNVIEVGCATRIQTTGGVGTGVGAGVGVGVGRGVGLGLELGVGVGVADGLAPGLGVGDASGLGYGDAPGLGDGEAPGLGVGTAVGVGVAELRSGTFRFTFGTESSNTRLSIVTSPEPVTSTKTELLLLRSVIET